MNKVKRLVASLVIGVSLMLSGASWAYLPVTELLPAIPGEPDETEWVCDGSLRCVDGVIREMRRRWRVLDARCDHDAVFALTYLVTTEVYRRFVADPHFFDDNTFVNNEDRLFANVYFEAIDAWRDGRVSEVPPAWQVAFEASECGAVSVTGSMLLGMNAHIQRDLPFVLERIGLVGPDGRSRKPDHDRVNEILFHASPEVTAAISARYEGGDGEGGDDDGGLSATALNVVIQGWREDAWRLAEALANASGPVERLLVEQAIEHAAWATAISIRAATASDSTARNARCARRPPPTCEPAPEQELGAEASGEGSAEVEAGGADVYGELFISASGEVTMYGFCD